MPSVHGACKAPIQTEVLIGVPYRGNEFIFLSTAVRRVVD